MAALHPPQIISLPLHISPPECATPQLASASASASASRPALRTALSSASTCTVSSSCSCASSPSITYPDPDPSAALGPPARAGPFKKSSFDPLSLPAEEPDFSLAYSTHNQQPANRRRRSSSVRTMRHSLTPAGSPTIGPAQNREFLLPNYTPLLPASPHDRAPRASQPEDDDSYSALTAAFVGMQKEARGRS